jgi:hypothetical protein
MMDISNTKEVSTLGDEIKAMSQINETLEGLEEDEKRRVLSWALDKHGDGTIGTAVSTSAPAKTSTYAGSAPGKTTDKEFERISDLIDAASPQSQVDYVLVATYWFQVIESEESVTGMQVNAALKDLGHGASNITDAYSSLKTRKHARQIQKSGSTRQARKRYRLTEEGLRAVRRMLSGE